MQMYTGMKLTQEHCVKFKAKNLFKDKLYDGDVHRNEIDTGTLRERNK